MKKVFILYNIYNTSSYVTVLLLGSLIYRKLYKTRSRFYVIEYNFIIRGILKGNYYR
jgi:hypothetical protein